jgi:hypothetical protein
VSGFIPTNRRLVRSNEIIINVTPPGINSLYASVNFTNKTHKINRRYSVLTRMAVVENLAGGGNVTHIVNANYLPDARNQINREFTFTDNASETITGNILCNINNDTGAITLQSTFTGGTAGSTYEVSEARFSFRFRPVGSNDGRTTISAVTSMIDENVDPNEDFLLSLEQEDIQDYNAVFKIDLLRTLTEAIKKQISLNADYDIMFQLQAAHSDIISNDARFVIDLDNYRATAGDYRPTNPLDLFKSIVPTITMAMGRIRHNFQAYPKYLVAGQKSAAILKSLQDMAVNLPGLQGDLGFTGATAQFLKLKIIESLYCDEERMYLSVKPAALENSTLIQLIYHPLYMVREVTDGASRTYVRSRTKPTLARQDGLAMIEIENSGRYFDNV